VKDEDEIMNIWKSDMELQDEELNVKKIIAVNPFCTYPISYCDLTICYLIWRSLARVGKHFNFGIKHSN